MSLGLERLRVRCLPSKDAMPDVESTMFDSDPGALLERNA